MTQPQTISHGSYGNQWSVKQLICTTDYVFEMLDIQDGIVWGVSNKLCALFKPNKL